MATEPLPVTKKPWTLAGAWSFGGLAVGSADITYALLFYYFWYKIPPLRLLQGVAAGLLGREASFAGGAGTAALGLALHYFIAYSIAAFYILGISRWLPALNRRPWLYGPIYGLGVYLFMNLVVVPRSGAAGRFPSGANLVGGLLIHMFGIGLFSALFARLARPHH